MSHTLTAPLRVALLLPGQGSQHERMAVGLYGWNAVFTAAMDDFFEHLGGTGRRLREDWLTGAPIDHVSRAQPLLFAVDHALSIMVAGWGVRPAAALGHSVGELAAATLAGVFTARQAATLIVDRSQRLAAMPEGGMLVVAAGPDELTEFLTEEVVVGAVNAPRQTMLAGPAKPLAAVAEALRAAHFTCRPVRATTAFHSPSVRPAVCTTAYDGVELGLPRFPLWSAYTARPLSADQAQDRLFWAAQPAEPVLFGPALDGLLGDAGLLLLEAGPGQNLSGLARRHPRVRGGQARVLALLPARPSGPEADRAAVVAAAEALHRLAPDEISLPAIR